MTTAPPPPPPAWGTPPSAPGTRPRRRRRWPWVLGTVLGAIVILLATGIILFVTKIKPPIDAANAFLEEVEDRDFDRAFDRLCAGDDSRFSPESLEVLFEFGQLADDYSVNPFGVDVDGSRATVDFDSDGIDDEFDYIELPLRKEDGTWRVCLSDDPDLDEDFERDELDEV